MTDQVPRKKGFAAMDAARQAEIASSGGRAAHRKGTAHQFTSDEAREAAKKSLISRKAKTAKQQQRST